MRLSCLLLFQLQDRHYWSSWERRFQSWRRAAKAPLRSSRRVFRVEPVEQRRVKGRRSEKDTRLLSWHLCLCVLDDFDLHVRVRIVLYLQVKVVLMMLLLLHCLYGFSRTLVCTVLHVGPCVRTHLPHVAQWQRMAVMAFVCVLQVYSCGQCFR